MSSLKSIFLVSKNDTPETNDLLRAAKDLKVPIVLSRAESFADIDYIANKASLVYWRSGKITNNFSKDIISPTLITKLVRQVPVINHHTVTFSQKYKSVQQEMFLNHQDSLVGLLPIPTYLTEDRKSLESLIATGQLSYPFIVKPNFGKMGEGIELIETENDLIKITDYSDKVFQPFIKNTGDYRIFVIGGVAHMVFKRTAGENSAKKYLNNVSQGGIATSLDDADLRQKLARLGAIVASVFDYTICGVDVLEGQDGNLYFMEVNSAPQWSGGQRVTKSSVAENIIKTLSDLSIPKEERNTFISIEKYYTARLDYLSTRTRFHFLSRLHLWSQKKKYKKEISDARESWWSSWNHIVSKIDNPDVVADIKKSRRNYREKALKKHPLVTPYNDVFFKCLLDKTIFNGTALEDWRKSADFEKLKQVKTDLIADTESLFALSTAAINFLYHFDHFFSDMEDKLDVEMLLDIPLKHKLTHTSDDLDARIYYYTHMIIGKSRFYSEEISNDDLPLYIDILKKVEDIISRNYTECTIDHKAEFIVCARLCKFYSKLEPIIRSELLASISSHGNFLVNRYNSHSANMFTKSLETAEHSNVLAIMAFGDNG